MIGITLTVIEYWQFFHQKVLENQVESKMRFTSEHVIEGRYRQMLQDVLAYFQHPQYCCDIIGLFLKPQKQSQAPQISRKLVYLLSLSSQARNQILFGVRWEDDYETIQSIRQIQPSSNIIMPLMWISRLQSGKGLKDSAGEHFRGFQNLFRSEKCFQQPEKNVRDILNTKMYQMKTPNFFAPDPSFSNLDYTYSFSKYSCVAWVYPLHIIFAYLVDLTGLLAILSRVITKLTPYHVTFGRWYLIFMLWCMATSLLIHNTGLPLPIIVSFLYLLFSITIGWNAIKLHVNNLAQEVKESVNERLNAIFFKNLKDSTDQIDYKKIETEERTKILATRSFKDRIFSWKMLHGVLFAFSWSQMIGRTFVTNPFTSFTGCWTYPAYKSMTPNTVFAVDSVSTPPFPMANGTFIAVITAPTLIIILVVALAVTYCIYRSDSKTKEVSPTPSVGIMN